MPESQAVTTTSWTVFVIRPGASEEVAGSLELPFDADWNDAWDAAVDKYGRHVCHVHCADEPRRRS